MPCSILPVSTPLRIVTLFGAKVIAPRAAQRIPSNNFSLEGLLFRLSLRGSNHPAVIVCPKLSTPVQYKTNAGNFADKTAHAVRNRSNWRRKPAHTAAMIWRVGGVRPRRRTALVAGPRARHEAQRRGRPW